MILSGHFIPLNFMDITVINILFESFIYDCFQIFLTNNITCNLLFCPNQDSLDHARQKATNYSSSNDSDINEMRQNPRISCKKHSQKTIISESDSESDVTSVIPNPPDLPNNISVNKISNNLNSPENVENVNLDITEGTIVSQKSNNLFYSIYSYYLYNIIKVF